MDETGFVIIGHRGAAGLAPENTLPSFRRALRSGCPMIELDVHCVRDRNDDLQLVVIHDDSLERTTNGHGPLDQFTLEQLRQLDAGNGAQIPLLQEVAELLPTHGAALNIELKGKGTAAPTAHFIQANPAQRVLVSSFDHVELAAFRALDADTAVAPLYDRLRKNWRTTATELAASCVNVSRRAATKPRIQAICDAGYGVFVYTVNDVEEAIRLQRWGASGVFTDRPDLMRIGA